MASRKLSAEDVLALLDQEEELDDPGEPFAEGSDEEFSDLEAPGDLQGWEEEQQYETGNKR